MPAATNKSNGTSDANGDVDVDASAQTLYDKFRASLVPLAGQAGELGDAEDLKLHRTLDRSFAKRLDKSSDRVLKLARSLVEAVDKSQTAAAGKSTRSRRKLQDEDDVVHEFTPNVQDTVDGLLEATDINLDIATGRRKIPAVTVKPGAPMTREKPRKIDVEGKNQRSALAADILQADIPKPQDTFTLKPDNRYEAPAWQPTLAHKHHAMVPLDYVPTPASSRAGTPFFGETSPTGSNEGTMSRDPVVKPDFTRHPYYHETKHLPYPSSLFVNKPAVPVQPFASTPFTYVDTEPAYQAMVDKLRGSNEIAVDLEYHATRSFTGFLCLMQISTREEDFVVDLLSLRDLVREDKLGGVLVDPAVVKVFHGAESDILWLQQDFDIYVVGLFDTYHATKVLCFPQHSLAFLLQHYCDFVADKRYQMVDWRIRPLPEEMLHYARSDTHFLLNIYDQLRNTLLERSEGNQDQVRDVLKRSAETAMKLYQKTVYDEESGEGSGGWKGLLRRQLGHRGALAKTAEYGTPGDPMTWGASERGYMEERVFRKLHAWRDAKAREEDESVHYIMPSLLLWSLTKKLPTTDTEFQNIVYVKNPVARASKDELLKLVEDGRQEGSKNFRDRLQIMLAQQQVDRDIEMAEPDQGSESDATIVAAKPKVELTRPSSTLWASATESSGSSSAGPVTRIENAIKSTLFGQALSKAGPSSKSDGVIRNILSQFSSTPKVEIDDPMEAAPTEAAQEAVSTAAPTEPEQVLYVPAASRTTKTKAKKDKVEVVTVKKAKKRKAEVVAPAAETATTPGTTAETAIEVEPSPAKRAKVSGEKAKGEKAKSEKAKGKKKAVNIEEIPDFDYSQEPNQLDTFAPESTTGKIKKQKKPKKPIVDTSNFRKPPQNPSDLQAGNRSRTFKK